MVERETQRALEQVTESELAVLSEGPSRELILESLNTYLLAVRANPATWRLVLMPPEGAPQLLWKRIEQGRANVLAKLTLSVQPSLAEDRDSPDVLNQCPSARRSPTNTPVWLLSIPIDTHTSVSWCTPAGA